MSKKPSKLNTLYKRDNIMLHGSRNLSIQIKINNRGNLSFMCERAENRKETPEYQIKSSLRPNLGILTGFLQHISERNSKARIRWLLN